MFEGELFPEPVTKEDREAYDRLVLLLLRLAVNPRQGRETLSLFRQLTLCLNEARTGFAICPTIDVLVDPPRRP